MAAEQHKTASDPGKNVPFLTLSADDYAQLYQREMELTEARNAAVEANRAKTNFLSRMSHDIRTPLNGILGMARIAQEHPDDPAVVADALHKIEAAGTQLKLLINDVLDMTRLESGKVELLHEPFDLCELLQRDGAVLHGQIAEKQLDIRLHYNQTHSALIGSPIHVQRVISNISSNAVKYSRPGGIIEYSLDEEPIDDTHARFRFTIRDHGIGISPEFLPHLFEPFSQERDSARTEYQGTGLGLAITKELVTQMGGTITVESQKDVGSTFVIELPLELDTRIAGYAALPEVPPELNGMRLLLAEDNPLNREIASYLLTTHGGVVTCAADGQEAVDIFLASGQEGHPAFDAILMDVMMPRLDGLAAARAIRASGHPQAKSIPIIAQTANAFSDDVRAALNAGMNDHLAKPLEDLPLLHVLAKYHS